MPISMEELQYKLEVDSKRKNSSMALSTTALTLSKMGVFHVPGW